MTKERTTQKQVGSLKGPYQVFRLVKEVELSPGRWEEFSEFFLVCLENFGPVSGFVTESLAVADAERWNADFFNWLGLQFKQDRLKRLMDNLDEGRLYLLKHAINKADKRYGQGSENIPSPPAPPTEGAKKDSKAKTPGL